MMAPREKSLRVLGTTNELLVRKARRTDVRLAEFQIYELWRHD